MRDLEGCPRDGCVEADVPVVVGQRHPHPLIRLQHRHRNNLRPERRQVDERRGVPVDEHIDVPGDLEAGRAPRAALIERGRRRRGRCRRHRGGAPPGTVPRASRGHPRERVVVGDDADLGIGERRIGADAVDERCAAWRGGELTLEDDARWPPFHDRCDVL